MREERDENEKRRKREFLMTHKGFTSVANSKKRVRYMFLNYMILRQKTKNNKNTDIKTVHVRQPQCTFKNASSYPKQIH